MTRRIVVWRKLLLCGLLVAGGVAAAAQPAVASSAPSNRPQASDKLDELLAVGCSPTKGCLAVGYYAKSPGFLVPLAMTRPTTGGAWTVHNPLVPAGIRVSGLEGVKCVSSPKAECIAVGSSTSTTAGETPLAEVWNWSTWKIVKTIQPTSSREAEFNAVSCTSSISCMGVGQYLVTTSKAGQILSEQWNGSDWTLRSVPLPKGATTGVFWGVSCATTKTCLAVGDYGTSPSGQPLLSATWNGKTWTLHLPPNPSGNKGAALAAVACTAANACVGTGDYLNVKFDLLTLGESWNGTAWTLHATPSSGSLSEYQGVACPASKTCVAAGETAGIWNGTIWTGETIPKPKGSFTADDLGVACTSTKFCVAVGDYGTKTSTLSMVDLWNGKSWTEHTVSEL